MKNEKACILLVDDDSLVLNILHYILENEHYKVLNAQNGQGGLQLAQEEQPDLILLDINLPDISGFSVCNQLKQQEKTKGIPIIFLTATGVEADEHRGFAEGAVDFLRKPVNKAQLCARVNNALEMQAARQKLEQQALDLERTNSLLKESLTVQQKTSRNLLQRDHILSSVNYVAKSFLKTENWDEIIKKVLKYLAENIDIEHVYLKTFEPQIAQRHHYTWYKPNNTITCSSIDLLAMWKAPIELLSEGAITGPDENIPSFLWGEFENNNIRTYLILPVYVYKQLWGCIGFDCSLSKRSWDKPLVEAMITSSEIIGTAVQRTFESRERTRLAAAINEFADCVLMTDKAGTIFYANPASTQVTGYLPEELVGLKLGQVQFDEHGQFECRAVLNAAAAGAEWHGEIKNRHKDGTMYDESVAIIPVKGQANKVNSFCVIKRDQTEKKRLESIAEAANLMDNVGFVFSGIRHELGNPLNSLKMAISVLIRQLDELSPEKIKEFLDRSIGEIKRMEYLLYSLKNFNVLEEQEIVLTDLAAFLENFKRVHEKDLLGNGVKMSLHVKDRVWSMVDERVLHQVFLNLLTNSVNALRNTPDPCISLYLLKKDAQVIQIIFQDNGCGVPEQVKQQLFKPFFTTKAKGTGLGLTIVKKMLTSMNCTVNIQGEVGQGTSMVITLPAERDLVENERE
ncbi:ATP-binding response regulator [Candidatus Electrothrix sp.]|uniref:ATP-binding response regulator n=1 Tax=Candidatus Electrothrix sp. TaxID=2170559 RepID=UPI0040577202